LTWRNLRTELGCVVVPIAARNGEGVDELKHELNRLVTGAMPEAVDHADPNCAGCTGCTFQARYEWTEQISTQVMDATIIASARNGRISSMSISRIRSPAWWFFTS
jgi:Fe2+ transport system protein B